MKLVTVCTKTNQLLNDWESTARHWGYDYAILGRGEPWEGFVTLITLVLDYLNTTSSPEEVVCVVDCYDLVIAGPPSELQQKIRAFPAQIIVGGEEQCMFNCFPNHCAVDGLEYPKFKHVNSGFVAGTASNLMKLYEFVLANAPHDDQVGVGMYLAEHCDRVHVDTSQSIVANVYHRSELTRIENRQFRHAHTGRVPTFVHTPFLYKDLGARSEMVRKHAVPGYQSLTTAFYASGLLQHMVKHASNPVYRPILFTTHVVLATIASLLALHFWWYVYFKSNSRAADKIPLLKKSAS